MPWWAWILVATGIVLGIFGVRCAWVIYKVMKSFSEL